MESKKKLDSSNKEKKLKRKEVLEKKKAVDEAVKAASVIKDHLASFPPFCQYDRNGLFVYLESGSGEQLSSPMKRYIQDLLKVVKLSGDATFLLTSATQRQSLPAHKSQAARLLESFAEWIIIHFTMHLVHYENKKPQKVTMEGPYGPEWPTEEKVKRREMVAPGARYIFVRKTSNTNTNETLSKAEGEMTFTRWMGDGDPVVGFVHYRFVIEEEVPVVYVYELQLEPCVQGKGLGKFLMQLIELIACKNHMGAVMLTVQKRNVSAMRFYTNKLRYTISTISPSRIDPLLGVEKSYEILCKTFDHEAKAKLEDNSYVGE